LPTFLHIETAEAIEYFIANPKIHQAFDAVIANPPFVKWDHLSLPLRHRVTGFLSGTAEGRIDMYLAHLKMGMEMTKPGGFLLYVLPHSFLLANGASGLRQEIKNKWWIRFLVDLSDIPVFADLGSYVILLVLQKPPTRAGERPRTTVARCRGFVGQALEDALEGKNVDTERYTVYSMDQSALGEGAWEILHPRQLSIKRAVERHAPLTDFLVIREGFITGADEVFVREGASVPEGEGKIYVPYLPDRGMRRYDLPRSTALVVLYPYIAGKKISAQELRAGFPKTWAYLNKHREKLGKRKSVTSGATPWWCPVRARPPDNMMRPKIVSPHLVLTPRFSLDAEGKFAVSRSPVIYPREPGDDLGMLQYYLAVLNSSVACWQILRSSHRYSRGYVMLEPKTLNNLRAPRPSEVDPGTMRRIQSSVEQRLRRPNDTELEAQIDALVVQTYGLSDEDRKELQAGG
ncbi:MAG: hypothetical protein IMZ69_03530, partial [Spirochaetes bacterium]|nr:hypothetical protein [Spirochaetota bacterium]